MQSLGRLAVRRFARSFTGRKVPCAALLLGLCWPPSLTAMTTEDCQNLAKPDIEAYVDYDSFMADILRYKKLHRECSELSSKPLPSRQLNKGPNARFIIISAETGLEDLGTAVANALSFEHPVYTEHKRYNRTTDQSFAFPKARSREMNDVFVQGAIDESGLDARKVLTEHELQMEAFAAVIATQQATTVEAESETQQILLGTATAPGVGNGSFICGDNHLCLVNPGQNEGIQREYRVLSPGGGSGYAAFQVDFN